MELRKRLNIRTVLIGLYVVVFVAYVIVGLKPAEAAQGYEISAELNIPSIGLASDVATLQVENHELKTPDNIVGSFSRAENKTLLIGHSSTVFQNLNEVAIADEIVYDGNIYTVKQIEILEKSKIDIGDATHRLIITAEIKD